MAVNDFGIKVMKTKQNKTSSRECLVTKCYSCKIWTKGFDQRKQLIDYKSWINENPWVLVQYSLIVSAYMLSHLSHVWLFAILWAIAQQGRVLEWFPCSPPGDLANPGVKFASPTTPA